jgi:hypothetical protein
VSAAFAGISIPTTASGSTFTAPNGQTFVVLIPGMIAAQAGNLTNRVIVPAVANFFRPSGPNYFLAASLSGGAVSKAVLDSQLGGTLRSAGPIAPFGDISAQLSDANSYYHAANFELKKKFAPNFQFLASYTWAHAIDFSSDLQTLLKPLNNRNLRQEKADSLFDQRHRFVFSGFLSAPSAWSGSDSGFRRFMHGFTIAPILEVSSGRPFNILTGEDRNADQQGSNERPSVAADGSLVLPAFFTDGSLGRNRGITGKYVSLDLGLTRGIRFNERVRLDIIGQAFNIFNRFNEASANPFFDVVNAFGRRDGGKYRSTPAAAFDPRQFQIGLKLNF